MNKEIARTIYGLLPQLTHAKTKGQSGRIGVIGGSFQFTGAPYFTAMSALKSGADMAHIFCAKSAATAIKAYSPEIIVHPVFTLSTDIEHQIEAEDLHKMHNQWLESINDWKNAISGWVIGPGLGRDKHMDTFFPKLVRNFNHDSLIVFDADGIYYLCQNPDLFEDLGRHYKVILTPNRKQLGYLRKHLKFEFEDSSDKTEKEDIIRLDKCEFNYDFNILVKGEHDYYLSRKGCYKITAQGGKKRCGGIGDILAGSVIACASWSLELGPLLGCWLTKKATKRAFEKERRGMTAPSVLTEVCSTFVQVEEELRKLAQP